MTENTIQVNTMMDADTVCMLDTMCDLDERNRAQTVRFLIRQEYERRHGKRVVLIGNNDMMVVDPRFAESGQDRKPA